MDHLVPAVEVFLIWLAVSFPIGVLVGRRLRDQAGEEVLTPAPVCVPRKSGSGYW